MDSIFAYLNLWFWKIQSESYSHYFQWCIKYTQLEDYRPVSEKENYIYFILMDFLQDIPNENCYQILKFAETSYSFVLILWNERERDTFIPQTTKSCSLKLSKNFIWIEDSCITSD